MNDALGIAAADAVLDRLPALASMRRQRAEPLTRSSNRVFRLRLDGRDYVMRFPGRARYVDVASEFANQRRAAAAGVAPEPVALDESSGAIVSRWLPESDRACAGADALARCLATLHHASEPFADDIDPRRALEWNLVKPAILDSRIATLAGRAGERLKALRDGPIVNCHGDPTAGNVIAAGPSVVQLVDWEYSHRNHAAWDLAIHCNEAGYGDEDAVHWLQIYNEAASLLDAPPVFISELNVLRGITALATAAWLVNHAANGDTVDAAVRDARSRLGEA